MRVHTAYSTIPPPVLPSSSPCGLPMPWFSDFSRQSPPDQRGEKIYSPHECLCLCVCPPSLAELSLV
ncbi:hypothetical protein Pcinc_031317 [Petrolisthes cinctipes]|uniref:Uncharacterized protein n=1 Tax=Petrolisthes cinctipes TaxID=88211 RepID=A0AAE1EWW6_PETCI|nr:hypothetical protein Pcinc_031317 [Petrolisthes cinctipes]